jgi:hypothetical protein
VAYLFKLRLTANDKRISKLSTQSTWINAGQGFEAKEATVRLEGWSRQRRAIVMRRRPVSVFGHHSCGRVARMRIEPRSAVAVLECRYGAGHSAGISLARCLAEVESHDPSLSEVPRF